jgi:hypothetical protein
LRAQVAPLLEAAGVSFPIAERGGHLHVRAAGAVWDFHHGVSREEFRASGRALLEPVVLLGAGERARLSRYVQGAARDPHGVLGRFDHDGVTAGMTEGRLDRNRPLDANEGHNCVSWIGEKGESLLSLVAGPRELAALEADAFTEPGAWMRLLAESPDLARVPMLVYWSPEPLVAARARAIGDWDYGI